MSFKGLTYQHAGTVGGAAFTASTGPALFAGISWQGSGGAGTVTVLDGSTFIMATSGANAAAIVMAPIGPIACTTNLNVTNSGAGRYTVVFSKGKV